MDSRKLHVSNPAAYHAEASSPIAEPAASRLAAPLPMPIANTANVLAQQLGQANEDQHNTDRTGNSFSLVTLLASVYLPSTSYVELTRLIMPDEENPFIQLENAETIDELIACHAGLENLLGWNPTDKLEILSTDTNDSAEIPAKIIKKFLSLATSTPQEFDALPNDAQREGINALASYLAEYIGRHPLCTDIINNLEPTEAVSFLERTSQANYATAYSHVASRFRHELALRAVQQDGTLLQRLPEDLKNNIEIVQQAIIESADAFEFVSDDFRNNQDLIKLMRYRRGTLGLDIPFAAADKSCPLMVAAAVRHDGHALHHADEKLQGDHNIVLAAVKQNGNALLYASKILQNNRDIVLTAIQQHGSALKHASVELRADPDVVLIAVKKHGESIRYALGDLENNFTIAHAAVSQSGWALKHCGNLSINNYNVVMAAVRDCGAALQFADDNLKRNVKIVRAAINQNVQAIRHAHPSLLSEYEDLRIAAQRAATGR